VTAPVETTANIEHLDHQVNCSNAGHKTNPPPAAYYFDQHGCVDGFLCARCMSACERLFARYMETAGAVRCPHCRRVFTTLSALAKVVPL
jgi:uncharacterized Zn-finger protein